MNKSSFKYAFLTTLITAVVIIFILLMVRSGSPGGLGDSLKIIDASIFWIPIASVFCTGYLTFRIAADRSNSSLKVIFMAILHFVFAHGLSFLLNIANFSIRELEEHPVKQATDILLSSLLFGSWIILPAYIRVAFWLNDENRKAD